LFPPVTACEGVTALYLYNNVNAFPRYQTLGLYSKINFQQFLETGWSPPLNKRQCWHCALSTFSLWPLRMGGQMPSYSGAEQSNKAVKNLVKQRACYMHHLLQGANIQHFVHRQYLFGELTPIISLPSNKLEGYL